MHVHDHLPLDELQRLAKAIAAKRVWLRYQAVILAAQGRSAAEVASALGCSVRAVQDWVARYNRGGPEALRERPHPGRPPRLAGPELARFRERLEAGPTPEDGICTFYGPDLRRILEREFGVLLGLQAVYDLLHRHGFSSLMPRPQHKDADEELQAIFKEVIVDQIQAIERGPSRGGGPGLVRGRGPLRPAGDAGPGLGPQGVAAPRRAADPVRLPVRADGGLRRHRGGLGADRPDAERRGGQPVPGAVLAGAPRRGPCGPGVGRGGLPHRRWAGGAGRT